MLHNRHIQHYLLILALIFMPMQSVWSMTEMAISSLSATTQDAATFSYTHVLTTSALATNVSTASAESLMPCHSSDSDNQDSCNGVYCSSCVNVSFIMINDMSLFSEFIAFSYEPYKVTLSDFLSSPEKPTPIYS